MSEQQKLIVLDDTVLLSLASQPAVVNAFPFIAQVKAATAPNKKCGPCARKAAARGNVYMSVRQSIAELPDSEKLRLKQVLNTAQLRVGYNRRSDGRRIELTF